MVSNGVSGSPSNGGLDVGHPVAGGEGRAVAGVAVEELEDAPHLAQGGDPLVQAVPVDRIHEPDPTLVGQRVRGPLHGGRLGGDPAEAPVVLVREGEVHAVV